MTHNQPTAIDSSLTLQLRLRSTGRSKSCRPPTGLARWLVGVALGISSVCGAGSLFAEETIYPNLLADVHVESSFPDNNFGSRTKLTIKSIATGETTSGARKAYFRFQAPTVNPRRVTEAEFRLTLSEAKWPGGDPNDLTFQLFGIVPSDPADPAVDDWTEADLTWDNAPANAKNRGDQLIEAGINPEPGKAVKLGTATLPHGAEYGEVLAFSGPDLARFLEQYGDRSVVLAVTRLGGDSDADSFFASIEQLELEGPTLMLTVSGE